MCRIDKLKAIIRKLNGTAASHSKRVAVKKLFQIQMLWDGIVKVCNLHAHANTDTAQAWFMTQEMQSSTSRCSTCIPL
jgi:hypothetical protein